MASRATGTQPDAKLQDVIHSIQAAALDPSLWPGVLRKVTAMAGAERLAALACDGLACSGSGAPGDAAARELHGVTQAALAALERLNYGVLLLGPEAQLRHANRRANDIARRTRAYSVGTSGRLQAFAPAVSAKLYKAVQAAAVRAAPSDGAGTALRLRGATGSEVHAFVVPVLGGDQQAEAAVTALMFVADPESTLPNFPEKLRQIYHLSPTEAQLAEALVNGRSLKQFAVNRGTSLNTVRTQLRSLAAKVGAKRQVDVVRCILTGPAVLDL